MEYEEYITSQAVGAVLPNDMVINGKVYRKGHRISQEDKMLLKSYDITGIYGAKIQDKDIDFKIAQNQITAKLSGKNIGYTTQNDGVCKIIATCDGLFMVDEQRVKKFNRHTDKVILNTISPYSYVKKNDIVARLDVVPPFMNEEEVDDIIFRLSGNVAMLSVYEAKEKSSVFVYPHLLKDNNENMYFTSVVMKLISNFDNIGIKHSHEINSKYNIEVLTDALYSVKDSDIIFVLSPMKSSSRDDVIIKAVEKYADKIINYGFPDIQASDFVIAQKGSKKIFVIPHAYDIADTVKIDEFIKYAIFSDYLDEEIFQNKEPTIIRDVQTLLSDEDTKIISSGNTKKSEEKSSVAVVVLAAGQGRRCGTNKLLAENKKGEPLFMKSIKSAIESNAKPVFVVTGYNHEEFEKYLEKYDINIIYNRFYDMGVQTSINAGLKSVPDFCDGAILLPADMPEITANEINKLIAKFDKDQEKSICVLSNKGIKSNPILWSKSLYQKAKIIPENAHMRDVLLEHNDYIKSIEIRDKNKLVDIDYPSQLKEYCEK